MSATPGDPSPLRFFASRDPLSHASDRPFGCSLGSSGPTADDASDQPKMAETPPMVVGIEAHAKNTVVGGGGGEDGASIDGGLDGCGYRGPGGRNRRISGRGGG